MCNFASGQARQQGAVLLVSLIFLVVLTLLGVSSMDGTILETKMALNSQEKNWSFQVAESALRQSQNVLNEVDEKGDLQKVMQNGFLSLDNGNGISISRVDGGEDYAAYARNVTIELKGRFSPPRGGRGGNASGINGVSQMEVVYFEGRSTGQNWVNSKGSIEADQFPLEITLRNGFRQGAPKLNALNE